MPVSDELKELKQLYEELPRANFGKKLTPEFRALAQRIRESGVQNIEIAEILGITPSRVCQWKLGEGPNAQVESRRKRMTVIINGVRVEGAPQDIVRIIRAYEGDGAS